MDIKPGKKVKIKTKEKEFEGIVIESYDPNVVLLKLNSGYNIGIDKRKIKSIKEIKQKTEEEKEQIKMPRTKKNLPGIAIIITGGTIASKVDYKTGGVKPIEKPEEILALAPKLNEIARITAIEKPFSVFSEDMTYKEWQELAKLCEKLLNKKENQGVIILQGTDTIHYTSAALSFMLQDLNKPVVLTYSQRSIDRGSSDAFMNLTCSAYACLSNYAEVMVVGHGTTNDKYCLAIPGTKVRKMHTSRRDTFRPINALPFMKIHDDGRIEKIHEGKKRNEKEKVKAETTFNEKVALLKWHPNLSPRVLDYFLREDYKGMIIEATGFGHVSKTWLKTLEKAAKKMIICFAPQTIYGSLNSYVYERAREINKLGVLYLKDILPETAYVKLGWLLGKYKEQKKVRGLMLDNLAHEFNDRLSDSEFMY